MASKIRVRFLFIVAAVVPWIGVAALGQVPGKVDFAKDIFPSR